MLVKDVSPEERTHMRVAGLILALAGGLIALVAVALVFFVVADSSVYGQLGIGALFAVAAILVAAVGLGFRHTLTAGIGLIVLSGAALVLGFFSQVLALRPLQLGFALSLVGGILALLAARRSPRT
jgi:hypothetical protein